MTGRSERGGGRALVAVVLVALLVVTLDGCGGDGSRASNEKTFSHDGFAITFRYPGNLREAKVSEAIESAGGEPAAETALAIDETNAIFLAKYDINPEVDHGNLGTFVPELDRVVGEQTGSPVGGKTSEVGGLPAIRYDDVELRSPPQGRSRLVYLFDGAVEYLVNCQSTPEKRDEITRACDRVLTTMSKS